MILKMMFQTFQTCELYLDLVAALVLNPSSSRQRMIQRRMSRRQIVDRPTRWRSLIVILQRNSSKQLAKTSSVQTVFPVMNMSCEYYKLWGDVTYIAGFSLFSLWLSILFIRFIHHSKLKIAIVRVL